jgi:hypothetical protein
METNFAPSRAINNFDVTLSMDAESILAIMQTEKLINENTWFIHSSNFTRKVNYVAT